MTRSAAEMDLRDRRLHVWDQARMIVERAATESRLLTDSESRIWDALNAELDDLDYRIKTVDDLNSVIAAASLAAGCGYCRAKVSGDRCGNCGAPAGT